MSVLRALRAWWTGRYESAPIVLMDEQMCREWVAAHPDCQACGRIIDPFGDSFCVTNDSARGASACHQQCPSTVEVGKR